MRSYRVPALLCALLLDEVVRDPAQRHPVAVFGSAAGSLERWFWRDDRGAGIRYVVWCVGLPAAVAAVVQGVLGRGRLGCVALAGVSWVAIGGSSLRREGHRMADLLAAGDLDAARRGLGNLCGRDASALDETDLARATVESIAENTSDAVVAPLWWAACGGLPGVVAYRAVNTLDAMVGHRTPRHRSFGWAAARLDDVANVAPARLTALLACGLAPLVGGAPGRSWRILRRDGGRHPSPNAGRCEAAFAGALDVRLGGTNSYGGESEQRGPHGDGRVVTATDIGRATRLSAAVGVASSVLLATAVAQDLPGRLLRAAGRALRWA